MPSNQPLQCAIDGKNSFFESIDSLGITMILVKSCLDLYQSDYYELGLDLLGLVLTDCLTEKWRINTPEKASVLQADLEHNEDLKARYEEWARISQNMILPYKMKASVKGFFARGAEALYAEAMSEPRNNI